MSYTLRVFKVNKVEFGGETVLKDGVLCIDPKSLEEEILKDDRLSSVSIDLALPGESVRIVHALDIIEPRTKADGSGCCFPGITDLPRPVGTGVTNCLKGVAVVETGEFPDVQDPLWSAKEAIIDMSGPGAKLSPFSYLNNVVLSCRRARGVSPAEYGEAVRLAGIKTAEFLAKTTIGLEPDWEEQLPDIPDFFMDGNLPRIVFMYQLGCEGGFVGNTLVYGHHVEEILPTFITPAELADGAVVSTRYHYGSQRNPTYIHQNNPVVASLLKGHGKDWLFAGVIITRGYNPSGFLKHRAAAYAVNLAKLVRANGAIISTDGGGNSHMDAMLICQECERAGIKTVVICAEMGGAEPGDYGLIHYVPEATTIVTSGNREEIINLPPVDKVIGGENLWAESPPERTGIKTKGEMSIPLRYMYCANSQVGAWNIMTKEF